MNNENITFCSKKYKLLYKGIDVGISSETVEDLKANHGLFFTEEDISIEMERRYNLIVSEVRNSKINEIIID
jgi:hypothetical protein